MVRGQLTKCAESLWIHYFKMCYSNICNQTYHLKHFECVILWHQTPSQCDVMILTIYLQNPFYHPKWKLYAINTTLCFLLQCSEPLFCFLSLNLESCNIFTVHP